MALAELAATTGRKPSNLSRSLKTMSHYGLVDMQSAGDRQVRPVAKATEFRILAGV
jgi:predicted transcriptional regulator